MRAAVVILLVVVASAQVQNDSPGFVTRKEFLALKNKVDILTKQLEAAKKAQNNVRDGINNQLKALKAKGDTATTNYQKKLTQMKTSTDSTKAAFTKQIQDLKSKQDAAKATFTTQIKELEESTAFGKQTIVALARQVSQQQLYVEETTRSYGDSGLKITRLTRTGSKPYMASTFVAASVAAVHDHSNYKGTAGMGELVAVLNGVEFRTRHNDYKLRMPSTTSSDYGATEDVPYPGVPPQVLAKSTVQEQIVEMREWFKAWRDSDYSKRDYRKYFQANLCYLEGQWTNSKGATLDEPFSSDRHSIDAKNFFDLQAKIRYTSETGRKSVKENYAYLPTTIANVDEKGNVAYSQWNYQILCHPLKRQVPLTRFRLEDDLGPRIANGKRLEQMMTERTARFSLYEDLRDTISPSTRDRYVKDREGTYLDKLMSEIPGKDNYIANLTDDAFGEMAYAIDADVAWNSKVKPAPLNVGFYHNALKLAKADAMGTSISRRGFSDANLYIAYNSRAKVTPFTVEGKCKINYKCSYAQDKAGSCVRKTCPTYTSRVSYAIPLEIIYTTPLQTWNPYKLVYHKDNLKPRVAKDGKQTRNGGLDKDKAYNGTSKIHYYITPYDFYTPSKNNFKANPADTVTSGATGFLDKNGDLKEMAPSGIKVTTKDIPDVGKLRIRYPIMPIHDYGNAIFKHVSALTDMTLKKTKYQKLYPDVRTLGNGTVEEVFMFETMMSDKSPPDPHLHTVELTLSEIEYLKADLKHRVKVATSTNGGHSHQLELFYWPKGKVVSIGKCDGAKNECWDGHRWRLFCPDCQDGYPVKS